MSREAPGTRRDRRHGARAAVPHRTGLEVVGAQSLRGRLLAAGVGAGGVLGARRVTGFGQGGAFPATRRWPAQAAVALVPAAALRTCGAARLRLTALPQPDSE